MNALELINIIQPEHSRTSCNDNDLNNGFIVIVVLLDVQDVYYYKY